ncbi:hypothetical protein [Agrococcus jejuensis]|uniref:LPXTG-motif cell wall anchor domain-containing protein n=1 Tax=Agrococcus jejuensis TaxID=399736 RepID=A0A1G8C1U0_9MICO|nr:hypothetical protein [Agrococcus jejuensis]SDH39432.1 hypothetical protein SAMN04489720_1135 [Agrococcus jejuensis]
MTRILGLVLGAILIAAGGLFFLQGIGVVGGSSMTNTTTWTVLGPLIALGGLVVLLVTLRRSRRR